MQEQLQEQRQSLYLNLINQLITCPNGEEPEVLTAHFDLIDPGFVQTLVQVSTMMAHEGNQDGAKFLVHIARELAKELGLYPQPSTTSASKDEGENSSPI